MELAKSRRVNYADSYLPVEQTVKQLTRAGSRDATRGIDKQGEPSATEREVTAEYGAAAQFQALSAQRSIMDGVGAATNFEPLPTETEIKAVQASWAAKLSGIATKLRAKLADQWNDVVSTQARLNQFKLNAGIDGDAVYPKSKVDHYGSLFLIGLAEAFANSWFYGSASPDGLGAGLLQAAVVSTVLVGSGAMAGAFAFRSCFSPSATRRSFGLAGAIFYGAFALFISLAAASFRDVLANDSNLNGLLMPISDVLVNPAGLSFEAITLLAFALMASGLAVYKGFTSDSAVPGHGALDRRYRRALNTFKDTWNGATDELTRCCEAGKSEIDAMRVSATKNVEHRERSLTAARSAVSDYEATTALLASGYEYAVKVYRDAVDVIEFTTKWRPPQPLRFVELDTSGLGHAESAIATSHKQLDRIRSEAADAAEALNKVGSKVQDELENYRSGLEATYTAGAPKDAPNLRVVAEQAV